jgi:hypothetical protein
MAGTVLAGAVLAVTVLAGVGLLAASPAEGAAPLSPPAIPPAEKAYLGAWVLPNGAGPYPFNPRIETELANLGEFQAELGRPLGLVHVYQNWDQPMSNSILDVISSSGAIPIIDWSCLSTSGAKGTTTAIKKGTFDSQIKAYAEQLKAYGKPVFLRWMWEQNIDPPFGGASKPSCDHTVGNTLAQDGAGYVAAWRHIWNIFKNPTSGVGATNVSFVWNPGIAGNITPSVLQGFWPGYHYVDWVGIDGYSRPGKQQLTCSTPINPNPTFAQLFAATGCTNLYATLSGPQFAASGPSGSKTLPLMIGETGATNQPNNPNHQRVYLAGNPGSILEDFQANMFPDIKAICYYDGTNTELGENGTWTLAPQVAQGGTAPSGFGAFATLANDPHFSFVDPG